MKFTPLLKAIQDAYTEAMALALRGKRTVKAPSNLQCASTQAIFDRYPALDAQHWNRPVPPEAQLKDVGFRSVTLEEVALIEGMRRRSKNTLGQATNLGEPSEAHWKAIQAWMKDGIALSPSLIAELQATGQLHRALGELTKSSTEEEFRKLMDLMGLTDTMRELVRRGD